MSLARDFLAVGQIATAAFDEDDVKNLRTGKIFRAKIAPIQDTSLNTDLALDPRATDIFYVFDKSVSAVTCAGDKFLALGSRFQVLSSNDPDNPASLHLEYHCMKLAPGIDT